MPSEYPAGFGFVLALVAVWLAGRVIIPAMTQIPKDALYYYETPIGTLWIRPQPDSHGRVQLGINDDMPVGSYHSAESAAEEVRSQTTGIHQWDTLRNIHPPSDLSEWTPRIRTTGS